jgi:hypothetical protein
MIAYVRRSGDCPSDGISHNMVIGSEPDFQMRVIATQSKKTGQNGEFRGYCKSVRGWAAASWWSRHSQYMSEDSIEPRSSKYL